MVIAIDFDGTCVTHEFPKVGKNIGAADVLKCLAKKGHNIILCTMRSHLDDTTNHAHNSLSGDRVDNDTLQEAIDWFKANDIPLYGVNENPSQKDWTSSPKIYAHLYIDDAALGIPLIIDRHERPFVDWTKVVELLCKRGIITTIEMHYLQAVIQKHDETMV